MVKYPIANIYKIFLNKIKLNLVLHKEHLRFCPNMIPKVHRLLHFPGFFTTKENNIHMENNNFEFRAE